MSGERFPCQCAAPGCGPCSSSSAIEGQPCPSCAAGAHRPSKALQDHFARGYQAWQRVLPISLGSSGLSGAQLAQARAAWFDWHAKTRCPWEPS